MPTLRGLSQEVSEFLGRFQVWATQRHPVSVKQADGFSTSGVKDVHDEDGKAEPRNEGG